MNRRAFFTHTPYMVLGAAGFSLAPPMASAEKITGAKLTYLPPDRGDKYDPHGQRGYAGVRYWVGDDETALLYRVSDGWSPLYDVKIQAVDFSDFTPTGEIVNIRDAHPVHVTFDLAKYLANRFGAPFSLQCPETPRSGWVW